MTAKQGRVIVKGVTTTTSSQKKTYTIGIISLGCAKNLVNTEQMMYLLKSAGYETTGETEADAVVVNTCGFIESAKTEAIETIIELGRAKEQGKLRRIIVAGCLAERYKTEVIAEMPEIDALVGTGSFEKIVSIVEQVLKTDEKPMIFDDINAPVSETKRIITTSPVWAYLKIAEGCDNKCAYCAIPSIRGAFRSRPLQNIISEAGELAERGIKELIIVAQDVTRYGLDIYGKHSLSELLKGLSEITGLKWIRLHYLYPDEIDEKLIEIISGNEKVLRYLDIPLQHINNLILTKMSRRGSHMEICDLIKRLRDRIPGVVLRTSIITGLPGEGEEEFEELCEFLKEMKIERAGVFPYSPEEGTPAALMDRPDSDIAALRAEQITELQMQIMDEFNRSRIGSVTQVLIEGNDGEFCVGRSFAESPEIDGNIYIRGVAPTNEFIDVRITGIENGELVGETI